VVLPSTRTVTATFHSSFCQHTGRRKAQRRMADQYQPGGNIQEQASVTQAGAHGFDCDGGQRSRLEYRGGCGQEWRRLEPHVCEQKSVLAVGSAHLLVHHRTSRRCAFTLPKYEPGRLSTSLAKSRRIVSCHGHAPCRWRRDSRYPIPRSYLRRLNAVARIHSSRAVHLWLPPPNFLPTSTCAIQVDWQCSSPNSAKVPTPGRNFLHSLRALAGPVPLVPRS